MADPRLSDLQEKILNFLDSRTRKQAKYSVILYEMIRIRDRWPRSGLVLRWKYGGRAYRRIVCN